MEADSDNKFNSLFLPNDLFKLSIQWASKESIHALIKFCENIKDSKGWYFETHYMHSKIKIIDPIVVDIKIVKDLQSYADVLKTIQVILCKENTFNSKSQYEPSTLDTNWN